MIEIKNDNSEGIAPDIYTYCDNMKLALEKFKGKKTNSLNGCTMKNTPGRDNAMYYVSDNSNLQPE